MISQVMLRQADNLNAMIRDGALELLERSELLAMLDQALAKAAGGRGRLVLLGGEAGVGKTTLLRTFCASHEATRTLWGACERLFTPRALGPLLDILAGAGLEVPPVGQHSWAPHEFVGALTAELRRQSPTVLVLEDLHWADEGTLDVIKLLGRRIESLPVLALASFRDDQLTPVDRLQIVLGELAGGPGAERHQVLALSLEATRTLAGPWGVDPDRLYEKTAGNPFFITEALAAGDVDIPETVRDAVLARAAPLAAPARRLLEVAAVVPSKIELWLLEAVAGDDLAHLDVCLGSGMLRHENGAVSFRHELARLAIEDAITPDRRLQLHRAVLDALADAAPVPVDPARLSYHADAAGDPDAVLRYAPAAGERAAHLCAHRLAAEQFGRALPYASRLPEERRVYLLERRSYECYLTGQVAEAIAARRAALALHEARGDRVRVGDSVRWLSRLAWFTGDNAAAVEEGMRAIALLVEEPPGPELAMAYSNAAQLRMLAGDLRMAVDYGGMAIELAERLDQREILVHALNNVGTAELVSGARDGVVKLERSLALALEDDFEEHVARAYTNLGAGSVSVLDFPTADRYLSAGIAYCEASDLDAWRQYMTGWAALSRLSQGEWDEASEQAGDLLRDPSVAVPSRITPLIVLGTLRARRGEADQWTALDEALELARGTQELQRLAPVACARAEARILEGEDAAVAGETDAAFALARERADAWALGALCSWRRRAGIEDDVAADALAPPFALEHSGVWIAAARLWDRLGCPYEAALARAQTDDETSLRGALETFQRLGATPAARATAQHLRRLGATGIGRGPRRTTIDNPAQLTARQLEILRLLCDRLTNAEIAARLYISPRTVDHHVTAILGKLGVHSRSQAAAEAVRLGLAASGQR